MFKAYCTAVCVDEHLSGYVSRHRLFCFFRYFEHECRASFKFNTRYKRNLSRFLSICGLGIGPLARNHASCMHAASAEIAACTNPPAHRIPQTQSASSDTLCATPVEPSFRPRHAPSPWRGGYAVPRTHPCNHASSHMPQYSRRYRPPVYGAIRKSLCVEACAMHACTDTVSRTRLVVAVSMLHRASRREASLNQGLQAQVRCQWEGPRPMIA